MSKQVAEIYEAHHGRLRGYVARRVPLWEDAEDIVQNVFYQLSRIDLVENPIEHISAWLYRVAQNQIIDRRRKRREEPMPAMRKHDDDDELLLEFSELLGNEDQSPETEYLKLLIREELQDALAELPPEQRSVFELNELQNVSFSEIAESTGLPVATLISRKRYAVLHLRERMRSLYDELLKY